MKPILYYAADCPDTAPFVAELKRLGVDYEAVEVLSSIPNLKQWLRLRDRHAAFDDATRLCGLSGVIVRGRSCYFR